MKVNSDAFESVARSIPVTVLAKHRSSIHQIEALLFGQAGLLNGEFTESYPALLQREYRYLQKKLSLSPVAVSLQFLRMRPGAFPTIRLAQLAALIQQSVHLFSSLLEAKTLQEVRRHFEVTANDFWHYHYTFEQASAFKKKTLGAETVENILINSVVPVLFAYGLYHRDEQYKEKALRWLEETSAEKNTLTKGFNELQIRSKTAYDSQALIELKNEYCTHRKCLSCAIGNHLLKREHHAQPVGTGTAPLK